MSRRLAGLFFAISSLPGLAHAQASDARLDFAGNMRMLTCDPVSPIPCFRMQLNVVDAQGHPVGVQFPEPSKLAGSMHIRIDNQDLVPFFAAAEHGTSPVQDRLAMVLIDISGSMNRRLSTGRTRFESARSAVDDFVQQFQNGSDEVAIVPFESHHVADAIREAHFAITQQDAFAEKRPRCQRPVRGTTRPFIPPSRLRSMFYPTNPRPLQLESVSHQIPYSS